MQCTSFVTHFYRSIHKAQGQTLQRVMIDMGRIFENGQAYVGLSRATSLQTLQVNSTIIFTILGS